MYDGNGNHAHPRIGTGYNDVQTVPQGYIKIPYRTLDMYAYVDSHYAFVLIFILMSILTQINSITTSLAVANGWTE